jgi:deazaflavin-dependent oxidoreductase (nitroreductase family)
VTAAHAATAMVGPRTVETQFFRLLNQLIEPRVRAGWASPRFVPGGLIVLETTGRRTGRRMRVPLAAIRVDGHIVVSTFRGGRSQWVKNAAADPHVRYWLRGSPRKARAHVITRQRGLSSRTKLPSAVRWLVRSMVPYTYAGWAFAVLAPMPATRTAS